MAQATAPIAAIRIKNILFATDFSEISAQAIPYVGCLGGHFGATIFPTHVIPGEPRYEVPMDQFADDLKRSRDEAGRKFTKILNHPSLKKLPQQVLIERGDIWPSIRELAAGHDIDMIVIGTHGRGGVGRLVFGSVAEQIYRQATCPVMVVGPHATRKVEDGIFHRLLFATDCSQPSLNHLGFVVDFANAFGAFLKIVSIVHENQPTMEPAPLNPDEVVAGKRRLLEKTIAQVRLLHQPEIIVERGAVGDSVVKLADVNDVDLIIMGARTTSRSAALSHVSTGVTHTVAAHARCPVLTLRIGDGARREGSKV